MRIRLSTPTRRSLTNSSLKITGLMFITLIAACAQETSTSEASGAASTGDQSSHADLPRTWDGRPDLNGVWQTIGSANWNVNL